MDRLLYGRYNMAPWSGGKIWGANLNSLSLGLLAWNMYKKVTYPLCVRKYLLLGKLTNPAVVRLKAFWAVFFLLWCSSLTGTVCAAILVPIVGLLHTIVYTSCFADQNMNNCFGTPLVHFLLEYHDFLTLSWESLLHDLPVALKIPTVFGPSD